MNIGKTEVLEILKDRKKDNINIDSLMSEIEIVAKSFPLNSDEDNILTAYDNLYNSSKMIEEQRQTIIKEDS